MRIRARYCWMIGIPLVGLLALWWALRSAGTAYDRIEIGMTKEEVRMLLGEPSRAWAFRGVMALPDGSVRKFIRNVEEWDRIQDLTRVDFEDGCVVEKSKKGLIAKFHDQAQNLLHWRRAPVLPPPVVPAPRPVTSPYSAAPGDEHLRCQHAGRGLLAEHRHADPYGLAIRH
jgi:hypothetical protein